MADAKSPQDGQIIIKKYANRRLYNTAKSSYVTLEDLSQMVQAGADFQVFDAKSGDDITRSVLAQIIFEQETKGQNMLPTNFLRQLIRLYGDALQSVVPGYLDASMEAFASNQERLRDAFGTNPAMASFETLARSNIEWVERAMRMFGPFPPTGVGRPAETGAAQSEPLGRDLEMLQRQLQEMQAQLERLSAERSAAETKDRQATADSPGADAATRPAEEAEEGSGKP
ncbi:MAG: polyhydroxyalkanoate synthesis repressor PhaR [Pikeienuella sp.]